MVNKTIYLYMFCYILYRYLINTCYNIWLHMCIQVSKIFIYTSLSNSLFFCDCIICKTMPATQWPNRNSFKEHSRTFHTSRNVFQRPFDSCTFAYYTNIDSSHLMMSFNFTYNLLPNFLTKVNNSNIIMILLLLLLNIISSLLLLILVPLSWFRLQNFFLHWYTLSLLRQRLIFMSFPGKRDQ